MPLCVRPRDLDAAGRAALVGWIDGVVCNRGDLPALLIVDSADSTERVFAHLRRLLIVWLADGQKCLFRYFDPMVLKHLAWMLDDSQCAALLGPCSSWCYWLDGQWRRLEPAAPSAPMQLRFDARLSAQLQRIAALNAVLATQRDVIDEARRIERFRAIDGYIARAQDRGWTREKDWEAFAQLCLNCHPRFDEHPRVVDLIEQALDDESEFNDVVCAMGDAFWASVVSDMTRQDGDSTRART